MQKTPLALLKDYWGYDEFRPAQKPIIDGAIEKQDVLALLPTGGGKSICFQIPGLYFGGLTLVISPLISLMEDQVTGLKSKGIKACAVTSALGYREIDILLNNAALGAYQFLYLSPERILSPLFKERLKQMPVQLIVVDEAHCISEWGHDFRPSYRNIQWIRDFVPEIPMMALTATATPDVEEDIITQLKLRNPFVYKQSFYRENLSYEVINTPNKMGSILAYCNGKSQMSGIVYCSTRRSVKELAKVFMANKLSASVYHGGMSPDERRASLKQWMKGEIPLMIATNAFGMGIDKPNVRYVLHYDFPDNLEAYVQEAGRGGRDGLVARSIAFVDGTETETFEEQFKIKFPEITEIKKVYVNLLSELRIAVGSGKNETYAIDLNHIANVCSMNYIEVYNSLKILELNQELYFDESSFHPAKVRLLVHGLELYNFQIKFPETHPVIQMIEHLTAENIEQSVHFSLKKIALVLKISESRLIEIIEFIDANGIIEFFPQSNYPNITFLNERRPDDYFNLSYESYSFRKENAKKKLEFVKQYIEGNQCRAQSILAYFGQNTEECGRCDICLRKNIPLVETEKFVLDALTMPLSFLEILERIPLPKEQLKLVIRDMQLTQKIQLIDGKFYR